MEQNIIYRSKSPSFSITQLPGRSLGRCYVEHVFQVRSKTKLPREAFDDLRNINLLGYGQEFAVSEPEIEADFLFPVVVDVYNKEIPGAVAVNKYTGQLYEPVTEKVFVYTVTNRVDSSD